MSGQFNVVMEHGNYYEGLRWHEGRWYASDAMAGVVFALDESGQREDLVTAETFLSGIGWMPDGSMLVVSIQDRLLLRRWPDGAVTTHADLSEISPHWINDMIVDGQGRAWVGTIGFAIHEGAALKPGELFRVDPDGAVAVAADGLWCPNGVVVTPDDTTLTVAETFAGRLTSFTIDADGELTERRVLAQFGDVPDSSDAEEMLGAIEVAPDGLAIDSENHVWVADGARQRCIRVSPQGEIVEEVAHPDGTNIYSVAIGGQDGRTLMLAASDGFFEAVQGVKGTASLLTTRVRVSA